MGVYYELSGSGPPIVFIHEAIADSRMWEPQWASFAGRNRLLRLDLAGFGRTPIERLPATHAQDVVGLLDELDISAAGVVGASLGGRVALELAVARPDLVRALVLVDAGLPGVDWSEVVLAYGAAEDEAVARGDLEAATRNDPRGRARAEPRTATGLRQARARVSRRGPRIGELLERVLRAERDGGDGAERQERSKRHRRLARPGAVPHEERHADDARGEAAEEERRRDASAERGAEQERELDVPHADTALREQARQEEEGGGGRRGEECLERVVRPQDADGEQHGRRRWQDDHVRDPLLLHVFHGEDGEHREEEDADEPFGPDAEAPERHGREQQRRGEGDAATARQRVGEAARRRCGRRGRDGGGRRHVAIASGARRACARWIASTSRSNEPHFGSAPGVPSRSSATTSTATPAPLWPRAAAARTGHRSGPLVSSTTTSARSRSTASITSAKRVAPETANPLRPRRKLATRRKRRSDAPTRTRMAPLPFAGASVPTGALAGSIKRRRAPAPTFRRAASPDRSSRMCFAFQRPAILHGLMSSFRPTTPSSRSRKTTSIGNRMKVVWMEGLPTRRSPSSDPISRRPSRPRRRSRNESATTHRSQTTPPSDSMRATRGVMAMKRPPLLSCPRSALSRGGRRLHTDEGPDRPNLPTGTRAHPALP